MCRMLNGVAATFVLIYSGTKLAIFSHSGKRSWINSLIKGSKMRLFHIFVVFLFVELYKI
jgi:hypothetical protein